MFKIPQIETNRLLLRAPSEHDVVAYEEFYGDAEASKFYGGPLSAVEAWNKLAHDIGHWHLRGYGIWTIERKDTAHAIGGCGIYWPQGRTRPELTWWISTPSRRMGFAKEASVAAIRFGYETLEWDLVQTHMKDENLAAKSLVLSLGGKLIAREKFTDGITRNVYGFPTKTI
ncbi:MAG: GNAT family N-acetyltransferase [Hyphomicrobiales bacterium]